MICVRPWVVCVSAVAITTCSHDPAPTEVSDSPPASAPWFQERAASAGIDYQYNSGHRERFLFPEIMGGGVALVDVDGDSDLDLYFVQGGHLLRPNSEAGRNQLYLNDGEGGFRLSEKATDAEDPGYGMGVATADYDRDGDVDLYVTNLGPNTLLRNDGGGAFTDVTIEAGVGDRSWGTGAAFVDIDRDGHLDLFVVNYIHWSVERELTCLSASGSPNYCSPNSYNSPAPDVLYRNRGDGTFEDVSEQYGLRVAFGNGLGIVTGDFDGNGFDDIFVANDQTPNQLWTNPDGTVLLDIAIVAGCAVGQTGEARAGMGVDTADLDDDLDLDLVVVNLHAQSDSMFRNHGEFFSEETALVGLALISRKFTRFGVGLKDFDNDGALDLYEANGRVTLPEVLPIDSIDAFAEANLLIRGIIGGRFEALEPSDGVADPLVHTSRAAAFGDIDNDGDVDIVVVNRDSPAYLLENITQPKGNWIGLQILSPFGADAIGAQVLVRTGSRTFRRDVRTAYSYLAANDPRLIVGLGDETEVFDVTIRWPDGAEESFGPRTTGRYNTLTRSD